MLVKTEEVDGCLRSTVDPESERGEICDAEDRFLEVVVGGSSSCPSSPPSGRGEIQVGLEVEDILRERVVEGDVGSPRPANPVEPPAEPSERGHDAESSSCPT